RAALYKAIDERVHSMFTAGLVEEAQHILNLNYSPQCKPFESLGYSQVLHFLRGELTNEDAIASTQNETRRYAKRQWTWFRRDKEMQWLEGVGGDESVGREALRMIREKYL